MKKSGQLRAVSGENTQTEPKEITHGSFTNPLSADPELIIAEQKLSKIPNNGFENCPYIGTDDLRLDNNAIGAAGASELGAAIGSSDALRSVRNERGRGARGGSD